MLCIVIGSLLPEQRRPACSPSCSPTRSPVNNPRWLDCMQSHARLFLTKRLPALVRAPRPFLPSTQHAHEPRFPSDRRRSFASSRVEPKAKGGSSSQWLERQKNDPYVRARAAQGLVDTDSAPSSYVSRAAFKLIELKEAWKGTVPMLRPGMTIVDLGAAPGGWIQAADQILGGRGTIVGVDLLPLHTSIPKDEAGIRFIQGDFTTPAVQNKVKQILREATGRGEVDLVVSDMMGNVTGNMLRDGTISLELCETALSFALAHLAPSTTADPTSKTAHPVQFVVKHFTSGATSDLRKRLASLFYVVKWVKPHSSRKASREGFFVCAGLRPGNNDKHATSSSGTTARSSTESGDLFF
jgi:23S rRNA (uridine2552-2'-O)-methyltransferase